MHFLDANSEKYATFQRFWPIFVRFWPLFYTPATVTTLFMVVFDSRGIIVNEIGGNSFAYINKNIFDVPTDNRPEPQPA